MHFYSKVQYTSHLPTIVATNLIIENKQFFFIKCCLSTVRYVRLAIMLWQKHIHVKKVCLCSYCSK